jgi:hypothetical protein
VTELVDIGDQGIHVNVHEEMCNGAVGGYLSVKRLQNGIQYQLWIFIIF